MKASYSEKDIRDRLSISTYVYRGHRPLSVKTLSELAEYGFRRIELLESPEQYDMSKADSMKHVIQDCRDAGVAICAYHAADTDLSAAPSSVDRRKLTDMCKRQIDTMLEAGGGVWGSHTREVDSGTEQCLTDLLRHVEGTEAVIVLENTTRRDLGIDARLETLNRIDHPKLGMILDVGHERDSEGENPMTLPGGPSEIIDRCGRRLFFLHLHGFVDVDHYPPFAGGDRIQWAELFQKLHDVEYRGIFNFEPRGGACHQNTLELTARAPAVIAEMPDQRLQLI